MRTADNLRVRADVHAKSRLGYLYTNSDRDLDLTAAAELEKLHKLLREMTVAAKVTNAVLERVRISGMDQNPKAFRDLIGSSALAGERLLKELG